MTAQASDFYDAHRLFVEEQFAHMDVPARPDNDNGLAFVKQTSGSNPATLRSPALDTPPELNQMIEVAKELTHAIGILVQRDACVGPRHREVKSPLKPNAFYVDRIYRAVDRSANPRRAEITSESSRAELQLARLAPVVSCDVSECLRQSDLSAPDVVATFGGRAIDPLEELRETCRQLADSLLLAATLWTNLPASTRGWLSSIEAGARRIASDPVASLVRREPDSGIRRASQGASDLLDPSGAGYRAAEVDSAW